MAKKRKTFPAGFEELLVKGDMEALKKVFNTCEYDAYDGNYSKKTALAFDLCPDELAKWLIDQGADINKPDYYGCTPLYNRAGSFRGSIRGLLDMGADVNICAHDGNTALHYAAGRSHNVENTKLLLEYGADKDVKNEDNLNVLEYALQQCMPVDIIEMSKISEVLVNHDTKAMNKVVRLFLKKKFNATEKMKKYVVSIGERFEFHREDYDEESVTETSNAVDKLYELFQVPPVPRKIPYDNKSKIMITKRNWKEQHTELWQMLVPSSGYSSTKQGEVIRISGRISDEVDRNGGVNWDNEYKKMGNAFLHYISTGEPLSLEKISKLKSILSSAEKREEKSHILAKYAVKWVEQNTMPIKMEKPDYKR